MPAPKYLNNTGVSLSMAVWLAHDDYDYNDDPNTISVTTLMKPVRQIVLAMRLPPEQATLPDIQNRVASRLGTAVHNEVERTWINHMRPAMQALGYPNAVIDRIRVNPTEEQAADPNNILVYLEQRTEKKVGRWTVSGKFDLVADGRLEDVKTTTTFTYSNQTKAEEYPLQGSLYRWLNPKKITHDLMAIQFLFTDWAGYKLKSEKNYPPHKVMEKVYQLKTVDETDKWVRGKLDLLERCIKLPETELPRCSDKELWKDDPVYKFYSNPAKTERATKNFDNPQDAEAHRIKAGKGIVIPVQGKVKACLYCPGFELCTQKDEYLLDGSLAVG